MVFHPVNLEDILGHYGLGSWLGWVRVFGLGLALPLRLVFGLVLVI